MSRRVLLSIGVVLVASAASLASTPPPQHDAHESTVTVDEGIRLYYRQVGTGSDAIVVPVAVWLSPHLDRLATPGRRVIYYDPRGRGRSDTGDLGRVSLDRSTRDLEALRTALGLDRMTLIGWSGYGMEMAAYALAHPDRVSRLIQLNPVPPRQEPFMTTRAAGMRERVDGAAWSRYQALAKDNQNPRGTCEAYNRAMAPAFSANAAALTSTIERICRLETEWPDRQQKFFSAFMPSIATLDLRSRIRELTMPRVVIHGDRDLIPLDGVREWLQDAPASVKLVVIPGADHTSFIDQPGPVLAAMEEFLR